MALTSDAVLLIYCEFDGEAAEHDDWHTYEHLHERLSIPGFLRSSRWVTRTGARRYLILHEVANLDVATSPAYLARLNDPTAWTSAIMERLRGTARGFCAVRGSAGYGLGTFAFSMRFSPAEANKADVRGWLSGQVLPAMASWRGMASVHLFEPMTPPPMTREQSLRGKDAEMNWVLLATAYDPDALTRVAGEYLSPAALQGRGISARLEKDLYAMQYTAGSQEVARTAANPDLTAEERDQPGPRPWEGPVDIKTKKGRIS